MRIKWILPSAGTEEKNPLLFQQNLQVNFKRSSEIFKTRKNCVKGLLILNLVYKYPGWCQLLYISHIVSQDL